MKILTPAGLLVTGALVFGIPAAEIDGGRHFVHTSHEHYVTVTSSDLTYVISMTTHNASAVQFFIRAQTAVPKNQEIKGRITYPKLIKIKLCIPATLQVYLMVRKKSFYENPLPGRRIWIDGFD